MDICGQLNSRPGADIFFFFFFVLRTGLYFSLWGHTFSVAMVTVVWHTTDGPDGWAWLSTNKTLFIKHGQEGFVLWVTGSAGWAFTPGHTRLSLQHFFGMTGTCPRRISQFSWEHKDLQKRERLLDTLRGAHFSLREKALPFYGIPKLQRDQETEEISPTSTFSPQPDISHSGNRKEFLTGISQSLPRWTEGVSISALQTTALDTKLRLSAHHSPWRC